MKEDYHVLVTGVGLQCSNEWFYISVSRNFSGAEARSKKGGIVRELPRMGCSAEPPDAGGVFKNLLKINGKFTIFNGKFEIVSNILSYFFA